MPWYESFTPLLFEILNSRFEHLHVELADNVLVKSVADTLAVTHLTEHSAVGRGDTLDSKRGAVGVVADIRGGISVKINVLGSDLTVSRKLESILFAAKEFTLTV